MKDSLIRLAQQTLHAQQHAPRIQHRAPGLALQDVQAYAPAEVDVGVVDGRLERHVRRGVGVVVREEDLELEGQVLVGCPLRAGEGGAPVGQVGFGGEGGEARGGRGHEG